MFACAWAQPYFHDAADALAAAMMSLHQLPPPERKQVVATIIS